MNFYQLTIYSLIAGVATLLGTALVLRYEGWARDKSSFLISFAAGVMLTISFMNLIPDADRTCSNAWFYVFAGFLLFYVLQQTVMFHACPDHTCHVHRMGVLSSMALTIHSLLDGVAIAVGFEASASLGILTALAVLLHEVPEGITITGILIHSNTSKSRVMIFSTIVALATPFGAIGSYFFLKNISPNVLGILLAFTAGSFIYLAAADLLPETHRIHKRSNALFFFAGVILIAVVGNFLH